MPFEFKALRDQAVPDHEFHRRRAEAEMEKALSARKTTVSLCHLELAKMHRERRERIVAQDRALQRDWPTTRIFRTDKEC